MIVPPGYVCAADLAAAWRTSLGAVYKRASIQGWHRVKVGRATYYRVKDIM